jgi:hypothetical protein
MIGKVGLGTPVKALFMFADNLNDTSGGGFNMSGAVDSYLNGRIGKAVRIINQTTNYPHTGTSVIIDPALDWSLSTFFMIESIAANAVYLVVCIVGSTKPGCYIAYNASTPKLSITYPNHAQVDDVVLDAPFSLNVWHFFTLSSISGILYIYVDTKQLYSGAQVGSSGTKVIGMASCNNMTSQWCRMVARQNGMTLKQHQRMLTHLKYGV